MACDLWRERLDAYIDGELQANDTEILRIHLKDCTSCSSDLISRTELKRAIQDAGNRYSPEPQFRRRIQSMIPRKKDAFWNWKRIPLLVATAAMIVVFVLGWRWLSQERGQLLSELADLHIAVLASSNPVDVASSDRHTVKPWFQGKIPFTFNLPDDPSFPLVGGRVAYLAQSPGVQLIFSEGKHRISVFIFQSPINRTFVIGNGRSKHKTFNIESWSHDGLCWFAIGDASSDDIHKLSESLRRAASL